MKEYGTIKRIKIMIKIKHLKMTKIEEVYKICQIKINLNKKFKLFNKIKRTKANPLCLKRTNLINLNNKTFKKK